MSEADFDQPLALSITVVSNFKTEFQETLKNLNF